MGREQNRRELVARAAAYHNSPRGKIARWVALSILVLGVALWILRLFLDPSIRHIPSTTVMLQMIGLALMIVTHVYRAGSWRQYWEYMSLGPLPAAWYQRNSERPGSSLAHAVFWLGAGLYALALWRQWSGV